MRRSKLLQRVIVGLILVAAPLTIGVPGVMGGKSGGGGEPGTGCDPNYTWEYVSPPYVGELYAEWVGDPVQDDTPGEVWIRGRFFQIGRDSLGVGAICDSYPVLYEFTLHQFKQLKAKDLLGFCSLELVTYFPCMSVGGVEIVKVNHLNFTSPTSFKAHVKLMQVIQVGEE